jgi:SET domain-containing protein
LSKRVSNSELSHYVYSAESSIHGTGLFAAVPFEKGEYIGTYDGPRASRNGMYVLWVYDPDNHDDIYGISGKNLLRYLNHESDGNAEFEGPDLFAARDIETGEELTFHYGDEWE